MHKIYISILIIIQIIIFSGCNLFGSDEENLTPDIETSVYENNEFSITYPSDWDRITPDQFTSEIPNETQIAFRNNIKSDIFTANINIVKKELMERLSSRQYADQVIASQRQNLLNFNEILKEDINMKISESTVPTYIYRFLAKQRASDQTVNFTQTYLVKGQSAYIATCAISENDEELTKQLCQNSIRTFELK